MRTALLLSFLACLPLAAQQNLLANGGFEQDANGDGMPDGWNQEIQQENQGAFVRDTDQHAAGAASLRIEHPDDNNVWVRSSQDHIPCQPRTLYRLDVKAKGTARFNILLYEFTPADAAHPYLTHPVGEATKPVDEWQNYGVAITTTDLAKTFKVSLITNGQGTAWFDEVTLVEVGSIPQGDAWWTKDAPKVDGDLSDACWSQASVCGPFYLLGGNGERPAAATNAQVVWTASDLYLAFRCDEPTPGKILAAQTDYDGNVYQDDCVEVFLDPDAGGSGFAQLASNSKGVRFDRRQLPSRLNTTWYGQPTAPGMADWDPDWVAAAKVGDDAWTIELRVPFSAFGGTPQPGDTWGANFCRERYASPELSTWSPLPGETFLQPANFGRLTFRGGPAAPPEILTRGPQHMPAVGPVVPQPKSQELGPAMEFKQPLLLVATSPEAGRYLPACAALIGGCEIPAGIAGNLDSPRVVQLSIAGDSDPVLPASGYTLVADQTGIKIAGADAMGVRNGLMTLSQLLSGTTTDRWMPSVKIRDWPDTKLRAWHVGAPAASEAAEYENWIETLARLKYNCVMIEVNDQFPYESHPEIGRADAPTKDQWKARVAYARELGLDVIPQVQVFGHFNWVLNKPGWGDLAESQPEEGSRWGRWNANIHDPRYYPLVFDLYQEVIDVFEPTIFHIGHDEITFRPIAVHPDTKDTKPHLLFAEEVTKLHDWLTQRDLKVMMWGDQFLKEHHGGGTAETYLATDLVPKDIIIADWHYSPTEAYPSVAYFKQHGFPVLCVGWWNPLNMVNFSNAAVDENVLGFSGSSWWGLANFPNSAEHQTAFVLAAENSWSNRRPTIDQLDYEPQTRWRQLSGWGGVSPETKYAVIDLSKVANQQLTDNQHRSGWLGLGEDQDYSMIPRGTEWWWGTPYKIAEDPPQAVMLATKDDREGSWPVSLPGLHVGTKAKALCFLHLCSNPPRRYGNIYDRGKFQTERLGTYVVHYADATSEELPLTYRRELTDWNAGLPPALGDIVWRGQTKSGAIAQLSTWRWENPHPEKVIDSVDIRSSESSLRLVVLALTAAVE